MIKLFLYFGVILATVVSKFSEQSSIFEGEKRKNTALTNEMLCASGLVITQQQPTFKAVKISFS